MTRQQEIEQLVKIIGTHCYGASVGDLMENELITCSRRTLQRRLELLVSAKEITADGNGRGTRYFKYIESETYYGWKDGVNINSDNNVVMDDEVEYESPPYSIATLSEEAKAVKRMVNLPLYQRANVTYNAEFLHDYEPNETYYLPEETRAKLMKMGKVGISEQPAGTYLRRILERVLIDLSWNSSRLEGNSYSRLETAQLLRLRVVPNDKNTEETQMLLNHKSAIEMLAEDAEEVGFNHYTICNLHAILADNLMPDMKTWGRLRQREVGIGGSCYSPLNVPQQIEEHFNVILEKAEMILDPFEASFFIMVHLPYLQAFEDVNKRVSRIAANIPLLKHNLCPISFVDVNSKDYVGGILAVYELNRIEYLREVFVSAYKKSCDRYIQARHALGEPDPFRLTYRSQITECVKLVVESKLTAEHAGIAVNEYAHEHLPVGDVEVFCKTLTSELEALHISNIARYKLRPNAFYDWKAVS